MSEPLTLRVLSREKVLYDGGVRSVSSVNSLGRFDVLADHANFVAAIRDRLIIYPPEGGEQEYRIKNGIMWVRNNLIEVFIGVGV